jgi:hypothetical protein
MEVPNPNTPSYFKNNGIFTNFLNDITDIKLTFGDSQHYPAQAFTIYQELKCSHQLYKEYSKLCNRYGHDPQLSFYEFKNNYPFVVFDLSKHEKDIFANGCQIKFIFTKTNQNIFRLYVLYIEDCLLKTQLTPQGLVNLRRVNFNTITS